MIIPEVNQIGYFLIAAFVLLVVPGPAVLFIVAKSIQHGQKAGLVSVIGIGLGGIVHVIFAALGLSAILFASTYAFMLIKYLGAFYLLYLGLKSFFSKTTSDPTNSNAVNKKQSYHKILLDGFIVNVFNPKTAIFFMAFLPHFVSLEKGGIGSQIIFLGVLFILLAVLSDSLYVLLSSKLSKLLSGSSKFTKVRNYTTGVLYFFLGLITLFTDKPVSSK